MKNDKTKMVRRIIKGACFTLNKQIDEREFAVRNKQSDYVTQRPEANCTAVGNKKAPKSTKAKVFLQNCLLLNILNPFNFPQKYKNILDFRGIYQPNSNPKQYIFLLFLLHQFFIILKL